jgi:signal transduction histidine kinase
LQTPIAALRASVSALRGRADLASETRERLLAVAADATEELGRLADDLLLASRFGADSFRVNVVPCDAVETARRVVEAARTTDTTGREITLSSPEDPLSVYADPDRLRQVLANLVGNALKHTPERGAVEIRLERAQGLARMTVSDEGPGIPEGERNTIFDRYQRGSTTAPGSGLGLHISRELIRAMGGEVRLEPKPGRGASFVVELPLA